MDDLTDLLKKRGYIFTEKSANYSDLHKIEKPPERTEYDPKLFNLFYSQPICRLLFQYMLKEFSDKENDFIDIEKITNFIYDIVKQKKIQNAIAKPPVSVYVCPNCKSSDYIEVKRRGNIRLECQNCNEIFNREKRVRIGAWERIGLFDINSFLTLLSETGFILEQRQIICYNCEKIEFSSIEKLEKQIRCTKCENIKDLKKTFTTVKYPTFRDINASWFEWYVCKILNEKCKNIRIVVPLQKLKNIETNDTTEVDILALTDKNKIISIDCKAKFVRSSVSKNDIENNILKWINFSDYLGVITTSTFSSGTKSHWESLLGNCETFFIEGNRIEKIPELLKGI